MIDNTSMPIPDGRQPDRSLSIGRHSGEVRALFRGHLLASSDEAVSVRGPDGGLTYYFPVEAVEMSVLRPNDRTAPRDASLGEAVWFTLNRDREILEDAAWAYPTPSAGAEAVCGMIAFNPDYVDIEMDAAQAPVESPVIDDYIRHTDSGSGRSQEAPWDPTVGRPGDGA